MRNATKILPLVLLVTALGPGAVLAQSTLTWTNTDSQVLSILSTRGITGGEQVDVLGQPVGDLTVVDGQSAIYPEDGEDARATVILDGGRDLYRFEGLEECAGVLNVRWQDRQGHPLEVLDARIIAAAAIADGGYQVQAVSTVTNRTQAEDLLVRGGTGYWVEVSFALGADSRGKAVTYSRFFETQVGCGQAVTLDVVGATGSAAIGLSDVGPAPSNVQILRRSPARDLLDQVVSRPGPAGGESFGTGAQKSIGLKTFAPGATSMCTTDTFDGPDLDPVWNLSFIGDADQGSAAAVGGVLQFSGDGTTLFHGTDNASFVNQTVTGDFRASVTLIDVPINQGGDFRKFGLMVRQDNTDLSPRVMVQLVVDHPVYNTTALQFDLRNENGEALEMASSPVDLSLPLDIAIDRRGDLFTVYFSTDGGTTWLKPAGGKAQGAVEIPMGPSALVGMALASYDADVEMTAEVDNFELCQRPNLPAPTPPPALGCQSDLNLDLIYLLDASGSMTAAFPGFPSKLEAAADAIAQTNALIGANFPGARSALVTFRGAVLSDPVFNRNQGAQVLSPLTTDLDAVSAAAAAIDPTTINVDANTPAPIALARTTQLLTDTTAQDLRRVVVWLTDGAPNIDSAGRGAREYRFAEILPLSIRDENNDFLPWDQVAWLGNFNGGIGTYDGEVFANTIFEIENMKETVPDSLIIPVAIEGEDTFYEDLLAYASFYNSTPLLRANDTTSLAEALAAVVSELDCGGSIGDLVWNDINGNGQPDRGEPPLPGVTVELRDSAGDLVATTVTDAGGLYLFEDLPPGTYTVTVVTSTLPSDVRQQTFDFDGLATPDAATVTLGEREQQLDVDFGYRAGATLGDRVWADTDGDGVQDAGEAGLVGVTVRLLDVGGVEIASQVTGADGIYLFEDLAPGTYTVAVDDTTLPAGTGGPTFDLDGVATPNQATLTVASGEERLDVDFGYQPTASIGDRVWLDTDGDGTQDTGEAGLEGVTVRLLDAGGVEIASQVTGTDGIYLFEDLAPGTYTVEVDAGTLPVDTGDPTFDLDGVATPNQATVTVAGGDAQLDVDFGYAPLGDECEEGTYRDDFSVSSFGNQDGTLDWSGDWIENDPVASGPGGGQVQVHDGFLTLDDRPDTGAEPSASREADLSNATRAVLRYEFQTSSAVDYDDAVTVEVSPDGGATWTVLEVITDIVGSVTAQREFDITAFASENTQVRFRVSNKYGGSYELFCVNWVEITKVCADCLSKTVRDEFNRRSYSNNDGPDAWSAAWVEVDPLGAGPFAGAVRVDHNGLVTLNLEQRADQPSIAREVNLAGTATARLAFSFITSSHVDADDAFFVEVSSDGGGSFTVIDTVDGISGYAEVERSYDISAFISERTVVRIRIAPGSYQGWGEGFCIDWVEVAALCEGEQFLGSISGVVWNDGNGNGVIEDASNGLAGVKVKLKQGGVTLAVAWTDEQGRYAFTDIAPGTYQVKVVGSTLPDGLDERTFDVDGVDTADVAELTLAGGDDREDVNFGYRGQSTCSYCVHYSGWLNGTGDVRWEPDGGYFWADAGVVEGWLEGTGPDFDLYLFRWQNGGWRKVAQSVGEGTSSEHIAFSTGGGYFTWKVHSWRGRGDYTLSLSTP